MARWVLAGETSNFDTADRIGVQFVIRDDFLRRFVAFSVLNELDVFAIAVVVAIRLTS
ncbi:hypothetical protein D3C80_2162910 [compost metagenome]